METRGHGDRSASESVLASVGRVVLVSVLTAVQTATLGAWLWLVRSGPPASRAAITGLGVLAGGLFVEHVLADRTINDFTGDVPLAATAAFSLTETAVWAVWLLVAERVGGLEGVVAAGVALVGVLVVQHTIEDNVFRGERLADDVFDVETLGYTVVEAAGATAWLALVVRGNRLSSELDSIGTVGAGVVRVDVAAIDPAAIGLGLLGVALFVGHAGAVAFSRRA